MNFNGSFHSVGIPIGGGKLQIGNTIILPAPNRYRKLMEIAPNPKSPDLGCALDSLYDNDLAIKMQKSEFDLPNPIGFQFDLFDTYIAWETT